jgi:hypothetical protein
MKLVTNSSLNLIISKATSMNNGQTINFDNLTYSSHFDTNILRYSGILSEKQLPFPFTVPV